MDKTDLRRGLLFVSVFALCLLASWGAWILPISHGEVLAAWFQGFGTVTAVIMAVALALRGEGNAKAAAAARENSFISSMVTVVAAAKELLAELDASVSVKSQVALDETWSSLIKVQRQVERLAELPIQDWPSPFMLGYFDEMRLSLEPVMEQATLLSGRINLPTAQSWRTALHEAIASAVAEADNILDFAARWTKQVREQR